MGARSAPNLWKTARAQHGAVARRQLIAAGLTPKAIRHRLATGRLRVIHPGVYAVGQLDLTQRGRWMAAVLACGEHAVLSHASAAALMGIVGRQRGCIEVSVPRGRSSRSPGIRVHRPTCLPLEDLGTFDGIPVTSPVRTLIDLATFLPVPRLEAAINAADKHDLANPEQLRAALEERQGLRGVRALCDLLDRHTFRLTRSKLERYFLPIVRRAGLPTPETRVWLNGYEVDFFWPDLGLVVETDGQRYHRTAISQTRDRERDQAHARAGLTQLRFSHFQVRYEPEQVASTLVPVARRLVAARARAPAKS